jgi:hypothetical protein
MLFSPSFGGDARSLRQLSLLHAQDFFQKSFSRHNVCNYNGIEAKTEKTEVFWM